MIHRPGMEAALNGVLDVAAVDELQGWHFKTVEQGPFGKPCEHFRAKAFINCIANAAAQSIDCIKSSWHRPSIISFGEYKRITDGKREVQSSQGPQHSLQRQRSATQPLLRKLSDALATMLLRVLRARGEIGSSGRGGASVAQPLLSGDTQRSHDTCQ